eukprot:RCo038333
MAHAVFVSHCLPMKFPHAAITALAHVNGRVFIGTVEGSLLVYEVRHEKEFGGEKYSWAAHESRPRLTDKNTAVSQLVPLRDLQLILALLDPQAPEGAGEVHPFRCEEAGPRLYPGCSGLE